jgi:hypothetical protein
MHAVRVPLLGIAVAMALLVVENLGALAYRDYKMASLAAAVQRDAARPNARESNARLRETLEAAEATVRKVEELTREAGAYRVRHCNER